jgi:predicted RecB family nuclease
VAFRYALVSRFKVGVIRGDTGRDYDQTANAEQMRIVPRLNIYWAAVRIEPLSFGGRLTYIVAANNRLTFDVLDGYLHCKYLGFLRLGGQRGETSEYSAARVASRQSVWAAMRERIAGDFAAQELVNGIVLTRDALRDGPGFVLDAELQRDDVCMHFDALKRVAGRSSLGDFHYVPVLVCANSHIHKPEKLLVEVLGTLLADVQGITPRYGLIYHGKDCTATRVSFSPGLRTGVEILQDLSRLQDDDVRPTLLLNEHCRICEFAGRCHQQAVQEDNLSLLRGLGQKAIKTYSRRGIFTLTQLAHTFRPRRNRKRATRQAKKRYYALQALAIRDRRVYVLGAPDVPAADVRIYLDLEGNPDEGFVYLIGMIVAEGDTVAQHSFWADTKQQERTIFERFLEVVSQYDTPLIFCYGNYERAFIKRMRFHARRKKLIDKTLGKLVNILGLIYAHFYFPTYTNGLKEIGGTLGSKWTDEHASGIQSITWRQNWENTHDDQWKARLVAYNLEDCSALRTVTDFLQNASSPARQSANDPTVVHVQDLDRLVYAPKWGATNFANADFAAVNACAYFDYQQQRVFVRSSKTLRKHLRKTGVHHNRRLRVNQHREITSAKCPTCNSKDLIRLLPDEYKGMHIRSKRALDLVITAGGMNRRVVECRPAVYRCGNCGHHFKPERYIRAAKHGHALMSWAMNAHVAHRLSYGTLQELFREFFDLSVTDTEIHMFKALMARTIARRTNTCSLSLHLAHCCTWTRLRYLCEPERVTCGFSPASRRSHIYTSPLGRGSSLKTSSLTFTVCSFRISMLSTIRSTVRSRNA